MWYSKTHIFSHIKRLNLGGNDLSSIPQKALSILGTLKKLEIQENKIRAISEGDFEGDYCYVACAMQLSDLFFFLQAYRVWTH